MNTSGELRPKVGEHRARVGSGLTRRCVPPLYFFRARLFLALELRQSLPTYSGYYSSNVPGSLSYSCSGDPTEYSTAQYVNCVRIVATFHSKCIAPIRPPGPPYTSIAVNTRPIDRRYCSPLAPSIEGHTREWNRRQPPTVVGLEVPRALS